MPMITNSKMDLLFELKKAFSNEKKKSVRFESDLDVSNEEKNQLGLTLRMINDDEEFKHCTTSESNHSRRVYSKVDR